MDPLDIPTARLGQEFSHDQSSMTLIMCCKFEALTPPPPWLSFKLIGPQKTCWIYRTAAYPLFKKKIKIKKTMNLISSNTNYYHKHSPQKRVNKIY